VTGLLRCAKGEGVHERHHQVQDDQVGRPAIEVRDRLLPIARGPNLVALVDQDLAERLA
jgi:hypothetical protein